MSHGTEVRSQLVRLEDNLKQEGTLTFQRSNKISIGENQLMKQ